MHVVGSNHLGIATRDLAESVLFYEQVFGFEAVATWVRNEPYIRELTGYEDVTVNATVMRHSAGLILELTEYKGIQSEVLDPATGNPGAVHIALNVKDLEASVAELRASGVRFVSGVVEPTVGPNRGGRAVYLLDPNDVRIELIESSRALTDVVAEERLTP